MSGVTFRDNLTNNNFSSISPDTSSSAPLAVTYSRMCPIVAHGALQWESQPLTAAHTFCLLEVRRAQVTLPSVLECDSSVKSTTR